MKKFLRGVFLLAGLISITTSAKAEEQLLIRYVLVAVETTSTCKNPSGAPGHNLFSSSEQFWNDYYAQNGSAQCADLRNLNLGGARLQMADLRGVLGVKAKLKEALMGEATVGFADFSKADLRGADLNHADGIEANFVGANLSGASLKEAILKNSNLSQANLVKADLEGVNLTESKLQNAKLGGATLVNANLENADLSGADLRGADLTAAVLESAKLKGAKFNKNTLLPMSISQAQSLGMVLVK